MKASLLGLLLLVAAVGSAQSKAYDKALADSLGADEYGMKLYVLVLLKTGPATGIAKAQSDSLFAGHMSNMGKMAAAGKLVVAGPMKRNERQLRGIFILNVRTLEEAQALLQDDPAIRAKLLDTELYQWYGSAALPMYLDDHGRIEKATHR